MKIKKLLVAFFSFFAFNLKAEIILEDIVKPEAITPATSAELSRSWQIGKIGANLAWIKSTGLNVKVGVVDTGVFNHSELTGRLLAGYNFVSNKTIAANTNSDDNGHGTHVSGIIAANSGSLSANSVVGIAPEASIIPIKVLDRNGSGTLTNLSKGLAYSLTQNARVVNMSLGWEGAPNAGIQAQLLANIKSTAVSGGQVIVVAAGNSGFANPSWPAQYASQAWANGQMIAVGAVDQNNQMPIWSNRAGNTKDFYLVAPGVNITSTYNGSGVNQYATLSGTSMATPVVAGAAALLASYWPSLSANKIVNILLTTSTDLGATGVDSIYGYGLLNVDKAINPIVSPLSSPSVLTVSGGSIPLSLNTQALPSAYSNALGRADLKVAALDDYGRDYIYDLSSLYARKLSSLPLASIFSEMESRMKYRESFINGLKMTMTEVEPEISVNSFQYKNNDRPLMGSFSLSQNLSHGDQFGLGINTNINHFLGFSETPFERINFSTSKAFNNPYLSFSMNQNYLAYAMSLDKDLTLSTGITSSLDPMSMQGSGFSNANMISSALRSNLDINASFVEIAKKWNDSKLALSAGSTSEKSSLLGGSPGSVFGIDGTSTTQFINLSIAHAITKDTWMATSYTSGLTHLDNQQNSLLTSTHNLVSSSWSIGILKSNLFNKLDNLGLALSQPMTVTGGQFNLSVPTGLDQEGQMQFANQSISLKPVKIEKDVELNYFTPLDNSSALSIVSSYRFNPGNDENANPDKLIAFKWFKWF